MDAAITPEACLVNKLGQPYSFSNEIYISSMTLFSDNKNRFPITA